MQRLLTLVLILQIFFLPVYGMDLFEDDLVKETLGSYKNKGQVFHNEVFNDDLITKDLVEKTLNYVPPKNGIVSDNLVITTLMGKEIEEIVPNINYDYQILEDKYIYVKIDNRITTRKLVEGQKIDFHTSSSYTFSDGSILPCGTKVLARIETISNNEALGVPANLKVARFNIEGDKRLKIIDTIEKKGANRAIWVCPVAYTFFGFGGCVLLFVRGGHAKINPRTQFKLTVIEL